MKSFSDEAKQLRLEVVRLRPGRGRRYTPALRRRVLAWVAEAHRTGMLDSDCSNALGIPQHRFEMWRELEQRPKPSETPPALSTNEASVSLVPIQPLAPDAESMELPSIRLGLGLAFVSPHGYRVEGLTYEQAFALLKEFE